MFTKEELIEGLKTYQKSVRANADLELDKAIAAVKATAIETLKQALIFNSKYYYDPIEYISKCPDHVYLFYNERMLFRKVLAELSKLGIYGEPESKDNSFTGRIQINFYADEINDLLDSRFKRTENHYRDIQLIKLIERNE